MAGGHICDLRHSCILLLRMCSFIVEQACVQVQHSRSAAADSGTLYYTLNTSEVHVAGTVTSSCNASRNSTAAGTVPTTLPSRRAKEMLANLIFIRTSRRICRGAN
jgi:hypothetical protein